MTRNIHLLIKDPRAIHEEVRAIVRAMHPSFDFSKLDAVYADVETLFEGGMHGFNACDTQYHDWGHTMGVYLASARLLHGVHVERHEFSARTVELTLTAALFHDTGYIRRMTEGCRTGGMFTKHHVQRGIDLLEDYGHEREWPVTDFLDMECMITCTDPARNPDTIVFMNIETMLAGHILGTADLISQMADDIYLEKLPFLFLEFVEGGITDFTSEYDLFLKTMGFYSFMRIKMENQLSNVLASIPTHFRIRHGVEQNFYTDAVDRNMNYLATILQQYGEEYRRGLRRNLDRAEHPITVAA